MSFENALDQYKKNEMKSHIKIDDVIIKAVQEVGEMIETKTEKNMENLAKETADAVVNILSASK
jgi:NTP pyrophosphatase (non-canonical NTP hydrolase)